MIAIHTAGAAEYVEKNYSKKTDLSFSYKISNYFKPDKNWTEVNSTENFRVWVKTDEVAQNKKVFSTAIFKINPKIGNNYFSDGKTVVIYPIFTDTAYSEKGFYDYYNKKCDSKCLEIKIQNNFMPQANPNTIQILNELGYAIITDVDVDKNPEILKNYEKVILLHNEYVTQNEFDAITKHPNVIYLFPNALYGKIDSDYSKNTIKLVRGHGYPDNKISNGFDWQFDNTKFEKNTECKNMKFFKVDNGWMLNCYPQNKVGKSLQVLKAIKLLNN